MGFFEHLRNIRDFSICSIVQVAYPDFFMNFQIATNRRRFLADFVFDLGRTTDGYVARS